MKFFSFFLGVACVIFEHITNVWQATCRAQRAHLLRYCRELLEKRPKEGFKIVVITRK